ncbi:hypothetical protein NDR87_00980 [Nocardia sp. CDC159]|uniref:Uncharacterized protein n=1 Tax=Nocardia pulmonis TaxID=2951408 RepID=A0A9X2E3H4_9NOCA|nr:MULTISPECIES: hypothetical protein [Nocardia]MCM6772413.1 hypothetical protein [Nocardia pulmonis]MCM6784929.1 hypothetical protein [Nocardia sp. CDC159]
MMPLAVSETVSGDPAPFTWTTALSMLVFCALLCVIVRYMQLHPRASMGVWGLSILTFPLWIWGPGRDIGLVNWFSWAKILSVLIPLTLVGAMRVAVAEERAGVLWRWLRDPRFLWFPYAILFLNIAEETIRDVDLGNYWNAAVGLGLCLTIPYSPRFWEITAGPNAELIAYTTVAWNFIYTSWNLCFTFGGYPPQEEHFAGSICILAVAEIYPLVMRRPELYIMARIYTLPVLMLVIGIYNVFPTLMPSHGWFNERVWIIWGAVNFVMLVPMLFWHTWQLHTGRAFVTFRRGQARQNFIDEHGRTVGVLVALARSLDAGRASPAARPPVDEKPKTPAREDLVL